MKSTNPRENDRSRDRDASAGQLTGAERSDTAGERRQESGARLSGG